MPATTRALYDRIGGTYSSTRRPDPRIAALIDEALGVSVTVVNVGAGTGAYEPTGRRVVAIEPSETMIRQRSHDAAPAILAHAESLPLADASVDAALAVLTVHHWADAAQGLRELRRVARGPVVVFTHLPQFAAEFWLCEYLPSIIETDLPRLPPLSVYEQALGPLRVRAVLVPHDCTDGFLASYWRRPERYLDEPAKRSAVAPYTSW